MRLSSRGRRIMHAVFAVLFAIQIPIALITGLKQSVPYLVFLSLWALVASHWAAYEASVPIDDEEETEA